MLWTGSHHITGFQCQMSEKLIVKQFLQHKKLQLHIHSTAAVLGEETNVFKRLTLL